LSNTRTDEYGGSIENRSRFLFETIEAVKGVYPNDNPLWVRVSADEFVGEKGWTLKDTLWLAEQLYERYNVDVIDVSAGGNNDKQQFPPLNEGYQVLYAEAIKRQHPQRYVATVGLLTSAKFCNEIIKEKKADLVLVAREFLRNPHLPLGKYTAIISYHIQYLIVHYSYVIA
jgi:2,4-dienoyl-CoA reductase-like NADH-dependent reductase (Old Yellow Enzyme family)